MSDDGNFVLRWDLHEETRISALQSLWKNEEFLDVTIACDDYQIDAHKVILSAASPFFQKILTRNPHNHPLLYLRGTTKKDMQSLLDFIYSGETQILQEELEDFMALANSLEVKGLARDVSGKEVGNDGEVVKKGEERNIIEKECLEGENNLIPEMIEEKKPKSRKKPSSRKKENVEKEDAHIVELSEDIIEIEHDISDIMKKYGSSEEDESFQCENKTNTSITEFDLEVSELVARTENGWSCVECSYSSKHKAHAKEHSEQHVEGFSHDCKYCDKTFSMKRTLRHHIRKCKQILESTTV